MHDIPVLAYPAPQANPSLGLSPEQLTKTLTDVRFILAFYSKFIALNAQQHHQQHDAQRFDILPLPF